MYDVALSRNDSCILSVQNSITQLNLRRWCGWLSDLLGLQGSSKRGYCVTAHAHYDPQRFRHVRGAVLLLSLLAQADRESYVQVLEDNTSWSDLEKIKELMDSGDEETFRPERIRILETDCDDAFLMEFLGDLASPPTPSFRAAVKTIMKELPKITAKAREIEIPISLDIEMTSDKNPSTVRQLLSLHAKYGGWRFPVNIGTNASTQIMIVIDSIDVLVWGKYLRDIGDLVVASGGLTLGCVSLSFVCGSDIQEVPLVCQLAHRTFCGAGRPMSTFGAVDEVTADFYGVQSSAFHRICTAIAHSKTTTSIKFSDKSFKCKLDRLAWQCVAFALFSEYARTNSSINEVHFDRP